jgi:hypothetical protein
VLTAGETDFDPLTNLRAESRYGRPNFDVLFKSMREGIERGTYLPGMESSLKTTVGGELKVSSLVRSKCRSERRAHGRSSCSFLYRSVLLRSICSCQITQGFDSSCKFEECQVFVCERTLCELDETVPLIHLFNRMTYKCSTNSLRACALTISDFRSEHPSTFPRRFTLRIPSPSLAGRGTNAKCVPCVANTPWNDDNRSSCQVSARTGNLSARPSKPI